MNIHFIAIGGSAMHNLAIALHNKGYQVTGSDDTIHDPSKSRLEKKRTLTKRVWLVSRKNYATVRCHYSRDACQERQPRVVKSSGDGFKNIFVSRIFI